MIIHQAQGILASNLLRQHSPFQECEPVCFAAYSGLHSTCVDTLQTGRSLFLDIRKQHGRSVRARLREKTYAPVRAHLSWERFDIRPRPAKVEYRFNLDEYMVTLEKPIGIRFAQMESGRVYVEALAKHGHAENSKMVMVGDVLKKTSAVFGDDMWDAQDFGRVMYAIKTRSGPVNLVFERTAQVAHTQGTAFQSTPVMPSTSGRVGFISFRGGSGRSRGEQGVVGRVGQAQFRGRGQVRPSSVMVEGEDADVGYKGMRAVLEYEAKGSLEGPSLATASNHVVQNVSDDEYTDDEDSDSPSFSSPSDPGVDFNEALARLGSNLQYQHQQGMSLTWVLRELLLGSCLQTPADVALLSRELGVTCVLNLQPKGDQVKWRINGQALAKAAGEEGLAIVNHPIRDFDARDLRQRLPVAVGALHRLLRQGHRIYVCCTAGLGTGPSVVIAYLYWHGRLPLETAYRGVTNLRPSVPNRAAIAGATQDLLDFIRGQTHRSTKGHPVQLVWNHGGRNVLLVGEFGGGWFEPMPAKPIGGPRFALEIYLPQGKYRFKFIVDGQWRHAGDLPTEVDEWGNINNVVHVGPTGVVWGGLQLLGDRRAPQGYSGPLWDKDNVNENILERPLTDEERKKLTFAAARMAFSLCPISFQPKVYY